MVVSIRHLCDTLATCPGSTLPLGQSQLGLAAALCDPLKNVWVYNEGVLHSFCSQNKTCTSVLYLFLSFVVMKFLFRHFTEYLHKYPQLCNFSVIKCGKTQDDVFLTSCPAP